jgi:hypothetical protein
VARAYVFVATVNGDEIKIATHTESAVRFGRRSIVGRHKSEVRRSSLACGLRRFE